MRPVGPRHAPAPAIPETGVSLTVPAIFGRPYPARWMTADATLVRSHRTTPLQLRDEYRLLSFGRRHDSTQIAGAGFRWIKSKAKALALLAVFLRAGSASFLAANSCSVKCQFYFRQANKNAIQTKGGAESSVK